MANPLAEEARALNDRQLAEAVNEAYRRLFNLQFQKGTRQLQDGLAVRHARRQIARLRTVQRERQLAVELGEPLTPAAAPAEPELSPQKRRALEERAAREAEEAEDEVDAQAAAEDALAEGDAAAASDESEAEDTDPDAAVAEDVDEPDEADLEDDEEKAT